MPSGARILIPLEVLDVAQRHLGRDRLRAPKHRAEVVKAVLLVQVARDLDAAALVEPLGQLLGVLVAGVEVGKQGERRVLADEVAGAAVHALDDVRGDRIEHLAWWHDRVDRQRLDRDLPARLLLDIGSEALERLLIDRARLPERLALPFVFGGAGAGRQAQCCRHRCRKRCAPFTI
jgi:hypothetical protein